MNEKCKYCNYVSKCSQYCEYNSVICKLHRSFPKVVDKSYEELQQENQELKQNIKNIIDTITKNGTILESETKDLDVLERWNR